MSCCGGCGTGTGCEIGCSGGALPFGAFAPGFAYPAMPWLRGGLPPPFAASASTGCLSCGGGAAKVNPIYQAPPFAVAPWNATTAFTGPVTGQASRVLSRDPRAVHYAIASQLFAQGATDGARGGQAQAGDEAVVLLRQDKGAIAASCLPNNCDPIPAELFDTDAQIAFVRVTRVPSAMRGAGYFDATVIGFDDMRRGGRREFVWYGPVAVPVTAVTELRRNGVAVTESGVTSAATLFAQWQGAIQAGRTALVPHLYRRYVAAAAAEGLAPVESGYRGPFPGAAGTQTGAGAPQAVVQAPGFRGVNVRAAPTVAAPVVATDAANGTTLTVLQSGIGAPDGEWWLVATPSGGQGFCRAVDPSGNRTLIPV